MKIFILMLLSITIFATTKQSDLTEKGKNRKINHYKNGKKIGEWIIKGKEKEYGPVIHSGFYKNGKRVGKWIEEDNCMVSKGIYKNGKKEGEWITNATDKCHGDASNDKVVSFYKNGKLHGKTMMYSGMEDSTYLFVKYYKNALFLRSYTYDYNIQAKTKKKNEERILKNGVITRTVWKDEYTQKWDDNKGYKSVFIYKLPTKMNGSYPLHNEGRRLNNINYNHFFKNWKLDGKYESWDKNGEKILEAFYKRGKLTKEISYRGKNIIELKNYKNGKLHGKYIKIKKSIKYYKDGKESNKDSE